MSGLYGATPSVDSPQPGDCATYNRQVHYWSGVEAASRDVLIELQKAMHSLYSLFAKYILIGMYIFPIQTLMHSLLNPNDIPIILH